QVGFVWRCFPDTCSLVLEIQSVASINFWGKREVKAVAAFFKVVVIIRLVIKRLFFLDLDEPHQRVHSS
ncbi:hypothetical protein ABMX70_24270, partial [Vibrio vulnificus]